MKRVALLFVSLVAACDGSQAFEPPSPNLARMIREPRVGPYEDSSAFPDGMGMRAPPAGAVPHNRPDRALVTGTGTDGTWLVRAPFTPTRARIEHGRERFAIVCATCHGVAGTGESVVAQKMSLRKPPSLHEGRIVVLPIGRLVDVMRSGYGLMPSFASVLDADARWDVALYVKALELSRAAPVALLPPDVRAELDARAP